ncbi:flagellar filament capping protein FliD [Rosenbergiella australiborealis]|uniref:Flagellar hook-associated protein 2 n=1 Tax=Rosenbergiella australiborealis TaxID=1544696 RepID=A0ABS5T795_9GAMM|nr:flagellar filament capping protein FliD [Rosenbergiella australiborealis]MBT0728225.1 flagellar filament capping protein FliD [Rosenbergiella australiborealis]
MATITNLNIGTGAYDLDALYSKLESLESQSLAPIAQQATTVKSQISAFGQLRTALESLQTATKALSSASALNATSIISSHKSFTATSSSDASVGSYQVNVKQLATAQCLLSDKIKSNQQPLGTVGGEGRTLTISTGEGDPVTIALNDSDTSLNGLVSAINKSNAGVVATSIKSNDGEYYLSISAKETGANNTISLSVSGDDQLQALIGYGDNIASSGMQQSSAGQDALLVVNGIEVQSASNTVVDAPYGVTLQLTAVSTEDERLEIANNTTDAVKNIKAWVSAYNNFQSVVTSITKFAGSSSLSTDTTSNGPLMGNGTVRDIQNQLRSVLTTAQSGAITIMAELGITQNTTKAADGSIGTLNIDENKLSAALTNNPQAVYQFFLGDGESSGFSTVANKALTTILSDTYSSKGILTNAVSALNDAYDKLEVRYDQQQSRIEATMARYKTQFTLLNKVISQMTQTKEYLTAQFSSSDD